MVMDLCREYFGCISILPKGKNEKVKKEFLFVDFLHFYLGFLKNIGFTILMMFIELDYTAFIGYKKRGPDV